MALARGNWPENSVESICLKLQSCFSMLQSTAVSANCGPWDVKRSALEAENRTWYWMAARCFRSSGALAAAGARSWLVREWLPSLVKLEAMTLDLLAWHGQRLSEEFWKPRTSRDWERALNQIRFVEASLQPSSMTSLPTVCLILLSRPTRPDSHDKVTCMKSSRLFKFQWWQHVQAFSDPDFSGKRHSLPPTSSHKVIVPES